MRRCRNRRSKKTFEGCDHRGFGRYCHLCADLEAGRLVEKNGRFLQGKKAGSDRAKEGGPEHNG